MLALLRADEGRIDNRIAEAHHVAIVCGVPSEGQTHWSLKSPADKAEKLDHVESIARETVRRAWEN